PRTTPRTRTEVAAKAAKPAAHLASHARSAPVTRQSGTSIRGDSPSRRGNTRLKRVLFLSAFASMKGDPASRAYYDQKRAEGKRHNQAVIALARRRSAVLFAMLRDRTSYASRSAQLAPPGCRTRYKPRRHTPTPR